MGRESEGEAEAPRQQIKIKLHYYHLFSFLAVRKPSLKNRDFQKIYLYISINTVFPLISYRQGEEMMGEIVSHLA